jgi:hypothetical protein
MKINKHITSGLVAVALAAGASVAQAGTLTQSQTNQFPVTGGAASWFEWYGATGTVAEDSSQNSTLSPSVVTPSGALSCDFQFLPVAGNGNNQAVWFGTFDNEYTYDGTGVVPLNIITNMSFDIYVDGTVTVPDASGNYGNLSIGLIMNENPPGGGNWQNGFSTFLNIPAAAKNNWVHISDPNTVAEALAQEENGYTQAAGVGFDINNYGDGSYPGVEWKVWIDNIVVSTSSAPPPPPPPPTVSIAKTVQGLNLFMGSGNGLNNRESLETVSGNYSWVGVTGPVTYAFTISSYPVAAADQVQNHIFLIPNPGTESAPDYNEPNVIFFDLESTATGATSWMFRYKTNEINGNTMIYGTGTLATIGSPTALGTWTVTFLNNTNVTMTTPGGSSTNFNIPDDATGDTASLFASGVKLYYGVQANNASAISDYLVASEFKVTGLGSSDFDDNFVTDAGVFNSSIWVTNAAAPTCVELLGPGNPYLLRWTTPAIGYSLIDSGSLAPPAWTSVTSHTSFQTGAEVSQFVNNSDLPAGSAGYFAVVQRNYSQLVVVLAGQTFTPGVAPGYSGPPSVDSENDDGGEEVFSVYAVDSGFNPVPGINDALTITDNNDGSPPSNVQLSNGSVTGVIDLFFTEATGVTITAQDSTTLFTGTSAPFTVGP